MSKFVASKTCLDKRGNYHAIHVYGKGSEEYFDYELKETVEILTSRYGIPQDCIKCYRYKIYRDSYQYAAYIEVWNIKTYHENVEQFYKGLPDSQRRHRRQGSW